MSDICINSAWATANRLRTRATKSLVEHARDPLIQQHYYADADVDLDFAAYLLIEKLLGEINANRARAKDSRS